MNNKLQFEDSEYAKMDQTEGLPVEGKPIESEAMREKAEWQMRHRDCQKTDGGTWYCVGPMVDYRHDMTDADWVKRRNDGR